jgi:hypothetical protein
MSSETDWIDHCHHAELVEVETAHEKMLMLAADYAAERLSKSEYIWMAHIYHCSDKTEIH